MSNKSLLFIFIVMLLVGCMGLNPSPNAIPKYSTLGVTTVLIKPQDIFEIPMDSTKKPFIDLLQEASTAQILTYLFKQRIGSDVIRVREAASSNHLVTVEAIVSLPISFPQDIYGINASRRDGALAKINIIFKEGNNILVAVDESIDWNDVRWSSGGHRTRRRRPIEDVLLDAVNKVVKKGIFKVQNQLNLKGTDS